MQDPAVLAAVSLGGVLGAEARYGMSVALPHEPTQIPVSTWLVNTSGCLLIGILMTVVMELSAPHRLVRPFLGVGFLGGYTTFSTYAVDAVTAVDSGRVGPALLYVVATPALAVAAATAGIAVARALVPARETAA